MLKQIIRISPGEMDDGTDDWMEGQRTEGNEGTDDGMEGRTRGRRRRRTTGRMDRGRTTTTTTDDGTNDATDGRTEDDYCDGTNTTQGALPKF